MNTSVHVWHFTRNAGLVHYVERLFARSEQTLSRFRPESELFRLNQSGTGRRRVSSDLFSALEHAFWFAGRTDGIYDPTVLPILEQIGYDRSFEKIVSSSLEDRMPDRRHAGKGGELSGYQDVTLDRIGLTVMKPAGRRFDLGGMGKGWTVDRASDLLHREGPFFLNAGGDIYAGGAPDHPDGWEVEIEDPMDPNGSIAYVRIRDRALATSSIGKRSWLFGGRRVHHLIDPRRRDVADTDLLSVTVIAARTVTAEILAKTALILGSEDGLAYLEEWPDAEGMLFTRTRKIVSTSGFAAYQ